MYGPTQAADDAFTEFMIDLMYRRLLGAQSREEQHQHYQRMAYWVGQRSPERVRDMERALGLTAADPYHTMPDHGQA